MDEPRTRRGRATRERIVATAAGLMDTHGVEGTSLDDILAVAGASKSQLYHYFANKDALIHAVVAYQVERFFTSQMPALTSLDSWEAIERWFDALVAMQMERGCIGGCPVGTLASELADRDEEARRDLSASFGQWQEYLVRGLTAMQARGDLLPAADPDALALATLASIEGGLLLTKTHRHARPLRVALDAALIYLRSYMPPIRR